MSNSRSIYNQFREVVEYTELERTVSNRDTLRRKWEDIMEVGHKDGWGRYLTQGKIYFLSTQVAPLLRFGAGMDVVARPLRIRWNT